MLYPFQLLPRENYKEIVFNLSEYFLVRHFEIKESDFAITDVNGDIEDKYLFSPSERLGDLSTSLLGHFSISDIYIKLTKWGVKEFGSYCNGNFKTTIPRYLDHFTFDDNRGCWFLKIGDIHNIELSFKHTDGEKEKKFICNVIHTPAYWNFWHFSVRWKFEDGKYFFELHNEGKISKGNLKRIAFAVRALLKKHSDIENYGFPMLCKDKYAYT